MKAAAEPLRKLRYKKGMKGLILNAPEILSYPHSGIPHKTLPGAGAVEYCDYNHAFTGGMPEPESTLKLLMGDGNYDGIFFVPYRKLSRKHGGDPKREVVWDALLKFNLKAVAQISSDKSWNGIPGRPLNLNKQIKLFYFENELYNFEKKA